MAWEYQEERFSLLASKLIERLNDFGKEGWEVIQIERNITPEVMRLNEILVNFEQSGLDEKLKVNRKYNDGFFDYKVTMKRKVR